MKNKLLHGDCLELMQDIPDGSVDCILCDLPYSTTCCSWDVLIPFEPLWAQYKRIIKRNGAIVLTGSQPFTTDLIMSNRKWFKYCWYWDKGQGTGFLNAKSQPLRQIEDVCIFYKEQPIYNPQMRQGHKAYKIKQGETKTDNYGKYHTVVTESKNERYPITLIDFVRDSACLHPTQKPVKLFEYLILTYSNPGDLILDNAAGSGTTACAAYNTGRNYICMEKDPEIYESMVKRVKKDTAQQLLPME